MPKILLALVLVLAACTTTGGLTMPVSMSGDIDGNWRQGPVLIGGIPFTYPIRAWGKGTYTISWPGPDGLPIVTFVGEGGWIVEPIQPQDTQYVEWLVATGRIRGARLSPTGTIARLTGSSV